MPQIGFETDIMSSGLTTFSQVHINNLASKALSLRKTTDLFYPFIIGRRVGFTSYNNWKDAVNSRTQGLLKWIKASKEYQH